MAANGENGYRPLEGETFMSDRQREYFRRKLTAWKDEILRESRETLAALQTENENHPDLADRASGAVGKVLVLAPGAVRVHFRLDRRT